MSYKRIELPYKYDALEPLIDKKTIEIHYEGHHKGYQDKLNEAIGDTDTYKKYPDLIELMKNYQKIDDKDIKIAIREYGGGLANHNFYFQSLKKDAKLDEELEVIKAIIEHWGSIDNFKKEFEDQIKDLFGSGWVWFVKRKNNSLKIIKTFNQDNPWFLGFEPLIGFDAWEHAYYLKHLNNKLAHFRDFWNLIDWNFVNEHFLKTDI